jgi:hypothetical protein
MRSNHDGEKLNNCFKPSLKLKSKTRVRSRYVKKYDDALTPFERLKANGILTEEAKATLEAEYKSIDPFDLDNRIQRRLQKIGKMKKTGGLAAVGEPVFPDCLRPLITRKT